MAGLVGVTFKQYRFVEEIGQGGMATVYRAMDTQELRLVAVKVLSPTISGDKRFVRRFRREASLLKRLDHPYLVPILDYDEYRGFVYLVMTLVRGDTLKQRLSSGNVTHKNLARWIDQVSQALDYAHQQGVIHRDVKPSNILIDDKDCARLTDFGIARFVEGSDTLTGSAIMGTPAYISPEQDRGDRIDGRSDLYSLGLILYEIHTGQLPFTGPSPMAIALAHMKDRVPPPREINPHLSPTVERVIMVSLEKDRRKRFRTVEALNNAYQTALRGEELESILPTQTAIGQGLDRFGDVWGNFFQRENLRPLAFLAVFTGFLVAILLYPSISTMVGASAPMTAEPMVLEVAPSSEPDPTSQDPAPTSALASPVPLTGSPLRVASANCPGLALFNFKVEGDEVSWQIDNGTSRVVSLEELTTLRVAGEEQVVEEIRFGDDTVYQGDTLDGDAVWVAGSNRSLSPGQTKPFTLFLRWEAEPSGYAISLEFDNGCALNGEW